MRAGSPKTYYQSDENSEYIVIISIIDRQSVLRSTVKRETAQIIK